MGFDEEYFKSDDFRELLRNYEESVEAGTPAFLDADDFIDIADYYNMLNEPEKATETVDYAIGLYPGAVLLNVFKARQALQDYDFEAARQYADAIDDKDSPDYHYLKAEILIAENRLDEADQYLREYYRTVPPDEHDDFVKDVINLYVDYDISDKAYEWLLRSRGDDSEDFKELMGRTLFGLGKYQDSQRIFNELIDRNPFSKHYWNALASAQYMDEDYSGAVTSSEYAIAIDPTDPEGLLTKASSLFRMGNYEMAADYFGRYTQAAGADPYALLYQGTCLVNLDRCEEAIVLLQQAVANSDQDSDLLPQMYEELAFCHSGLGQPEQAMEALDKTENLPCDHINILVLRGHILLENGQIERAERYFKAAIKQSDGDSSTIIHIIVSLYDNHFLHAAYEMFKKFYAFIATPDFNEGYSYMALCCYGLGYVEEFLMYLRLAVDRNPREARLVLSQLFPAETPVDEYYRFMHQKLKKS